MMSTHSFITHLECSRCGFRHEHTRLQSVCSKCGGTLFARYDLEQVKNRLDRLALKNRVSSLWRYVEVLPVLWEENIVSLGEGYTPLYRLNRLSDNVGVKLYVKDDGVMPTGSFKARGQTTAISKAKELGVKRVALASAGNAGGAMATYAARAGLEAYVFMPQDAPLVAKLESWAMGAHVYLVDGLINHAAAIVTRLKEKYGWFDLSTLKEPYRVEGKKTMGYEIAEQFEWRLPDVVVYPTGGGTGLVGMWKAFGELEELGWFKGGSKPRMVAVPAEGRAPVVEAFRRGLNVVEEYPDAHTLAAGIRVPKPYAGDQILKVIRDSGGTAITVSDQEILEGVRGFTREGLFVCPEGGATLAAVKRLLEDGLVDKGEEVLLYNTGTGLKYLEVFGEPNLPVLSREATSLPA
ncbi:MAG: threonine synthase [Thermoprotei archaeon]